MVVPTTAGAAIEETRQSHCASGSTSLSPARMSKARVETVGASGRSEISANPQVRVGAFEQMHEQEFVAAHPSVQQLVLLASCSHSR